MSKAIYYWWYAYGRFAPGENNLPHFGQVIRHYREIRGWSKEELATVLQCTVRYVEMLESSKNTNMPDLLSMRIAIARILQIPLILLGVSPVIEQQGNTTDLLERLAEASFSTDQRTFTMFERMLALCWDACYTSSFQRAASDVAFCLDTLNDAAKRATGIQRDQVNAMRSRFYQLSGIIARDRMDFVQALEDGTKAVDLALELNNVELIAAAFEHRAGTYSRLKQQDFAFQDIKRALPYADHSRDVLKGNVYLEIALKSLQKPGNQDEKEKEVMGFLDEAGRIVRKGNLEEDGSFLKLNTASLHIERAKALTHFHRFQDAHNSYRIASKALSPNLISWQVNILIEEAETYLVENDIEACCEKAIKALDIIHSVQSRNREERIQKLYLRCQKKAPNNPQVYLLAGKLNALVAKGSM